MTTKDRIRKLGLPPDATHEQIADAYERKAYETEVESFVATLVPAVRGGVRGCAFHEGEPSPACFENVKSLLAGVPQVLMSSFTGPSPQVEEAHAWARDRERHDASVEVFVAALDPAIQDAVRACARVPENPASPDRIMEVKALIDAVTATATPAAEIVASSIVPSGVAPMEATPVSLGEDRDPVPLPPKMSLEKRPMFAAFVALRYAGITVRGAPGAAEVDALAGKKPSTRYLADSGHYSVAFAKLEAWADTVPGRWARVLDALRLWTGPTGEDATG